ncbi:MULTISPECIES: DUF3592 domain-containing protein [Cyanophyceae]|uniref:DUF3592 domain-containing protein n=1 Tax=Cyanophyceae TaxID=3028117 RepID=UPI001685C1F6|nr:MULTISPECIES: DUF3592 domain-containing protein [Cyanophyceae]MBD1915729.1 DUF3592 domain-containing protein [Phormidium sp. FACHB-77]MBD2029022.1 DUF3592 domain-containing protein [Phormidium sp. FACHB-322]MBD2052221.1 DUF3592 domain-containing protein [Leptolyngbya sp. FACHB-60]
MKSIAVTKHAFALAFLLPGIGMLAATLFTYKNTSTFLNDAIRTEGTVIELIQSRSDDSIMYYPVVVFANQDGEEIEFTSLSGSNPPSYSTGQAIEIFYLPAEPQRAEINDFFSLWGMPAIFGGLGSIFSAIGAGMIVVPMLKEGEEKRLKQEGTSIETDFKSVEVNTAYSVNGKHPFQVITQWQNPSTTEIHVFESNNLWYDPTDFMTRKQITVFIEKENPKKYFVDLSFLPKLAE